jgi:hypothetical protein
VAKQSVSPDGNLTMEDWETALRVFGGLRMHPLYSARIASFVAGFALALAVLRKNSILAMGREYEHKSHGMI